MFVSSHSKTEMLIPVILGNAWKFHSFHEVTEYTIWLTYTGYTFASLPVFLWDTVHLEILAMLYSSKLSDFQQLTPYVG